MNGQALVDLAVAKVVPITDVEAQVNVNTSFVLAAINEAYHTVERAALWKWSEAEATLTSVAGTRAYDEVTLAPDLATVQHIFDETTNEHLKFVDERQRRWDLGASNGIPYLWSRWGGDIILHPTPSEARSYTVRYYAAWDDIEVGTSPVFPSTYHDMLADFAASVLALRLPPAGDRFLPGSKAEPHRGAFVSKLQQMMADPRAAVTMDAIPNHDWEDYLTSSQDW